MNPVTIKDVIKIRFKTLQKERFLTDQTREFLFYLSSSFFFSCNEGSLRKKIMQSFIYLDLIARF